MKIRVIDYIEGRTETMISEGDIDMEPTFRIDKKWAGYPAGIKINMRTQKKNTFYDDNKCVVELIFDEHEDEWKWIDELTRFAKVRAAWIRRYIGCR
jgi:hypothetical protein